MIKSIFIRFFSLVLLTLVIIVFIELSFRFLFGLPKTLKINDNVITDPVLNHKWKPNSVVVETGRSIPYTLYINSQSWVGRRDVSIKKPDNTLRIFYVGDSNTTGPVKEDKKMTTLVEKELNKKLKNGKHIEVINTGTTSWSPSLYYLEIKNHILKFSPDIVVINVDMTDVRDDFVYRKLSTFDKEKLPIAVKPSDTKSKELYRLAPQGMIKVSPLQNELTKVREFLRKNSAFYFHFENYVLSSKQKIKQKVKPQPNVIVNEEQQDANWVSHSWTKDTQHNVDYSMFILGHTIAFLKERNINVVVTGVPLYPQYSGEWSARPHTIIKQTAQKYGALYLDSYELIKKPVQKADRAKYYWEEDPTHFNEEGNRLWADAQVSFLLKHKSILFDQ